MTTTFTTDADVHPAQLPPVDDKEQVYRRIPPGWYQPGKTRKIPQRTFMPRQWVSADQPGDPDGISVDRAALTTKEAAAIMPHNGQYAHLCALQVADLSPLKLTAQPTPLPQNPAHAVIPELNSLDRLDPAKEIVMEQQAIALRDCAIVVYEAGE